jgi:hypothetical protein
MPELGADFDTWGNTPIGVNGDQQKIDDVFKPGGDGTVVGINVGTGKTLTLAGTLTAAATAVMNTVSGSVFNFLNTAFQLKDTTDPTKIVQFDVSGMPAATTSIVKLSGGNTVLGVPIGTIVPYFLPNAPAGWVFLAGRTLGNATSGATERANADTERLFTALWNAGYTVLPSRGGSAAADYAASRQVTMPDLRSVAPVGLDNMGGTTARGTLPALTTLGGVIGEATHILSIGELPGHTHNTDPNSLYANLGTSYITPNPGTGPFIGYGVTATTSTGGGAGHNNVQPTLGVNYITPL